MRYLEILDKKISFFWMSMWMFLVLIKGDCCWLTLNRIFCSNQLVVHWFLNRSLYFNIFKLWIEIPQETPLKDIKMKSFHFLFVFASILVGNAFFSPLRPIPSSRGNLNFNNANNLQMTQIDVIGKHMEITPGKILRKHPFFHPLNIFFPIMLYIVHFIS